MSVLEEMVQKAIDTKDFETLERLLRHMLELNDTFGWFVQDAKSKFDDEFGTGNYSPQLKAATQYLKVLGTNPRIQSILTRLRAIQN